MNQDDITALHYAAKLIETSLDDLLNPTQESSTEGK